MALVECNAIVLCFSSKTLGNCKCFVTILRVKENYCYVELKKFLINISQVFLLQNYSLINIFPSDFNIH